MRFRKLARSLTASGAAIAVAAGVGVVGAEPARAAEVWTYQGWLTLDGHFDYVDPSYSPARAFSEAKQLDLYIDIRMEDGRVVDGFLTAGDTCIKSFRSASVARSATLTFTGQFEECKGTITLEGLGSPSLTVSNVNLAAPANNHFIGVLFDGPQKASLAGVNVSPAQPKLPPLAPPVLSVTTGAVDPVQQTILARVSVALPQGYPAVAQALTRQTPGSSALPLVADTWVAIPCGAPTTFAITATGTNTDPASQSTSTAVTPNCTARVPTLSLTSTSATSATLTYRLSDGAPVESATWTATSSAGPSQSGTAAAPAGGASADFTVPNLVPGTRTQVRMVVVSAGGQSRQSNVVDVWSTAPTFTYPAITG